MIKNNDHPYIKTKLENYLGGILQDLIIESLDDNTLVYSGGTDEQNRTNNFIESST